MHYDDTIYPTLDDLENDHEFCRKMTRLIQGWYDYFATNNQNGRQDLYFLHIDQWTPRDRSSRTLDNQPILTINIVKPILNQMLGEQRSQEIGYLVEPANKSVKPEVAELVAGRLREIDYQTKAQEVYQDAFEYALSAGYSNIFHTIEYEEGTNEKSIKKTCLKQFTNAFFDFNAQKQDKTDGRFCGYPTDLPKDIYHKLYPNAKVAEDFPSFSQDPSYNTFWFQDDCVRVVDVWIRIPYNETLCTVSDGKSVEYLSKKEADEAIAEADEKRNKILKHIKAGVLLQTPLPPKKEITFKRDTIAYKIMHVRMSYYEILELEDWPAKKYLPGIFVDCESSMVDGRQFTFSFLRNLQDPQRCLNYLRSASAEAMLNAHHLTWVGTPGNVKGDLIDYWKNPQRSKTILLANYDEKGNLPQPVPPPQISPSFFQLAEATMGDIMHVTGRYEALNGQAGNEKSGVAIDKRAMNSALASFRPFDNLKRAIQTSADITLELLPAVIEENAEITIRDKDGTRTTVKANYQIGDEWVNDMRKTNKYSVTVEVGAGQAVQRQANYNMIMQLISANPQALLPLLGDLAAEQIDTENSQQIVDRIRQNLVPPDVLAKEAGKPPAPPSLQQQQQAQAQQMAAMMPMREMQLKQQQMSLQQQKQQIELQKFAMQQKLAEQEFMLEQQKLQHEIHQDNIHNQVEFGRIQAEKENIAVESNHKHLDRFVKMMEQKNRTTPAQ